jgi:hypothetical protein
MCPKCRSLDVTRTCQGYAADAYTCNRCGNQYQAVSQVLRNVKTAMGASISITAATGGAAAPLIPIMAVACMVYMRARMRWG